MPKLTDFDKSAQAAGFDKYDETLWWHSMIIKRALKRVRSRESRRICIPERWRVNKVAKQIASSDTKQEHMKFWTLQIRAQEETTMANARLLMLLSFYIVSQVRRHVWTETETRWRFSDAIMFCRLSQHLRAISNGNDAVVVIFASWIAGWVTNKEFKESL